MKRLFMLSAMALFAGVARAQTPEVQLGGRFEAVEMSVRLSGEQSLGTMENHCVGYVGLRPTLVIAFEPGDDPPPAFDIWLTSDTDTVLGVLVPGEQGGSAGGPEACSDDEFGGHDPMVRLEAPRRGRYRVLAGPFEPGAAVDAVLHIRVAD